MTLARGYLTFGILVLLGAAVLEFRGASFDTTSDDKGDPRSIRNNPGSYRSTYYGSRSTYGK